MPLALEALYANGIVLEKVGVPPESSLKAETVTWVYLSESPEDTGNGMFNTNPSSQASSFNVTSVDSRGPGCRQHGEICAGDGESGSRSD